MDAILQNNVKSFIDACDAKHIDHILDQFTCENEEQHTLQQYLKHTSHRENTSSRMYLFLMLCHFFETKINLKCSRWAAYVQSIGFKRLVEQHLNFNMDAEVFVDECFKLWSVSPDNSSILQHPCKT